MKPVSAALVALASALLLAATAAAKLPPPSEEAKAVAAEAAAKTAYSTKLAAYELCKVEDKVVAEYQAAGKHAGKSVPTPMPTPACVEPEPFAYQPRQDKPIEAAGAHSPAATATSPPSTTRSAGEMAPAKKP